ncbi:Cytochrome c oxidase assembly protein COX19 [Pseudolycoriella hygida]|uniref:Cytochrome c oxidase assembly protein COX19 n=1 Tax=Pseudolycoriella hygida TaxID=35572 RepID=A0A9Q0MK79_9DIPT|nr:Cytochrome c oxidase assembly protein COX19 [Pseudolycoriella hygida]
MSSMTFGQKKFIPTAPDKGSFPLDHENICKRHMLKYMACLNEQSDKNSSCRDEAKSYLQCRMDNNLMAQEKWSKLGFKE